MIVYIATHNNDIYIGATKRSLSARRSEHKYQNKKSQYIRPFNRSNSDFESFTFNKLLHFESEKDMYEFEVKAIDVYKKLGYKVLNREFGGINSTTHPETTKIKKSIRKNIPFSEPAKASMRLGRRAANAKRCRDFTVARISDNMKIWEGWNKKDCAKFLGLSNQCIFRYFKKERTSKDYIFTYKE